MMKRYMAQIAILVATLLLFAAVPVGVDADEGEGSRITQGQILAIMEGDPAPFSGILLSEDVFTEYLKLEVELERERLRNQMLQQELEQTQQALMLQLRECQRERDELTMALANPRWIDRPETNRWIGFAGGVLVTAGAVKLAGELD
jgi:hypothetical protein